MKFRHLTSREGWLTLVPTALLALAFNIGHIDSDKERQAMQGHVIVELYADAVEKGFMAQFLGHSLARCVIARLVPIPEGEASKPEPRPEPEARPQPGPGKVGI